MRCDQKSSWTGNKIDRILKLPDFSCSGILHIRANYQRCGMNGNNGNKSKDYLIIHVLCIRCTSNCVREQSQKLF